MKLQQLVTKKLTSIIEAEDWTATIETDYANTGYILALDPELDTLFAIRFDFQTTYFTLELFVGAPTPSASPFVRASTINGASNSAMIDKITDGMGL